MIPTYNCSEFLKETLTSVLMQAMPPDQMQIEVVDDASTDADVEALVRTIGRGRVTYFRQSDNVGSLRNFETCLNRAQGHLVHLLHGDDRVTANFYTKFTSLFQRFPEAGAAFCNYYQIDSRGERRGIQVPEMKNDGILSDFLPKIAYKQRTQYVAMVVRRSIYEHLGAFYGVTYGEDWEMWVRIAHRYPIAYTPDTLAEYRGHANSITSQRSSTGKSFEDLLFVINSIQRYIPEKDRTTLWHRSMKLYTEQELYRIFNQWKTTDSLSRLISNVNQVLKLYRISSLYLLIIQLFFKKGLQKIWLSVQPDQRPVNASGNSKTWEWEFTAQSNWWNLEIGTLWDYRNLLTQFVRRDFLVSYQQMVLGPLWTLLQPVLTVFVYTLVFNKLVGISTGSVPPVLFYLSGTILWNFFNDVFSGAATTFTTNAELFSKVYFPRLIVPLSVISTQFLRLLIQLSLLIIVLLYFWLFQHLPLPSSLWLVYVPVALLIIGIISLSLGLIFSVITAKYRDLTNLSMIMVRMLMFITPVLYPSSIISKNYQWILDLNPLTPAFELFRFALFGEGNFTLGQVTFSSGCALGLLVVGVLLFNREKEALMDVL
jgi:lipopolysaccharide transport system permease protein